MVKINDVDPYAVAESLLGYPGTMLSGSKNAPDEDRVVWNANVCVNKTKIWFGDLSITKKSEELQKLADTLGATIFVLYEMDARFDTELNPRLENAVDIFEPLS